MSSIKAIKEAIEEAQKTINNKTIQANTRSNLKNIQIDIQYHRIQQNLTQRQLAQKAGISQSTIVRVEKGYTSNIYAYGRVLQALGKELILTNKHQ